MAHKNIVFMVADDLGKYVGAYGCKSTVTPNLDQMAADGVRFDLAFASTASCSGSRSTMYTGLHTHENGQYGLLGQYGYDNVTTHFTTFGHVDTAPRLFNENDYLTGIIGKLHVGPPEVYPYTVRVESLSRDVEWVADEAEKFFERAKAEDKPFFLTIGYHDPHRAGGRGEFGNHMKVGSRVKAIQVRPEDVEVPIFLNDLPEVRLELVEYYKAIYRLDQGIGFILETLKRRGLDGSTLVVFTSDNGPPFINAKTTMYDAGTCLPFIVKSPTLLASKRGIANPNLISFIDIVPTFLDYAGIDLAFAPPGSKSPTRLGRSFLPILESEQLLEADKWQQHIFGSHTFHEMQNYWPTRYMRSHKYKYHRNIAWRLDFPFACDIYASLSYEGIRNATNPVMIGQRPLKDYIFRPSEQLFDLENDPEEVHNLADDPQYKTVCAGMRKWLEAWQLKTNDLWLYRDGISLFKVLDAKTMKLDLEVPDRWDVDVENPGNADVPKVDIAGLANP